MVQRTAIVTGSARGIGEAIARRLAHEGYRVCINDIAANQSAIDSVVATINDTQGSGTAIGIVADVTKAVEVQSMIDSSVRQLGPLTIMVANAGICQIKEALKTTELDVRKVFDVNFIGLFLCCTLAAKQMIAQGPVDASSLGYRIIGAASVVSMRPFALASHYTASKHAVKGFLESFALEMAQYDISVNAYAPGYVHGAMYDRINEELSEIKGGLGSQTGTARVCMPDDVGRVVGGFLAGPDAQNITGQTIVIDY